MNKATNYLQHTPLGKKSSYISKYDPDLLFAIPRKIKREEIGVPEKLPFAGFDTWNAFELSWLNRKGKPMVIVAQFDFPCESPNIIESKSFKLYLNSFNNSRFDSVEEVRLRLEKDLNAKAGMAVNVKFYTLEQLQYKSLEKFTGACLDNLDIVCDDYLIQTNYLSCEKNTEVEETLYSDLLKSNCLVTGQPDWGSVQIHYHGNKINHEGLLKYIVSFRNHNEFHEQCVERIFIDIMKACAPKFLTVHACYTRRGGLDINPIRSSAVIMPADNIRLARQ